MPASEMSSDLVGVSVALALIVALRVLLPASGRHLLRQPTVFLALHVVARVAQRLLPAHTELGRSLSLVSAVFVLASVGRSGVLLVLDIILGRRMVRPLPRIVRDIAQGLVYLAVLLAALRMSGVELSSILTTSALLTAVVALSLQETLGNMVAGLAIQVQQPFDVGDWIQFDGELKHIGRVVEINWRATKVLTLDDVEVVVPNSTLAKAPITNFTKPAVHSRRSLYFPVPADVPPHLVQETILDALVGSYGVLPEPPPSVVTNAFVDGNVEYWVRFFTDLFHQRDIVDGKARDRIWYALSRTNIALAAPNRYVRRVEVSSSAQALKDESRTRVRAEALRNVDFLRDLSEERLHELATKSRIHLFAQGETVVRTGERTAEMFIVESGEASVRIEHSKPREVAVLRAGSFFGEMALMTGEPRNATVVAARPCALIVVDDDAMRSLLESTPELAGHVSQVIAERQAALTSDATELDDQPRESIEARSSALLARIKDFFAL
jgi:small-conductance mechanosensitive channel/CRP-like cAMP-binding protein